MADRVQRVEPGEFSVIRVQRSMSTIARTEPPTSGFVRVGMGSDSSGPTNYYYKTEFLLHSDAQPNVFEMTCQSNQNYTPVKRYLTVPEIRRALGNIFNLVLPPTQRSWAEPPARMHAPAQTILQGISASSSTA